LLLLLLAGEAVLGPGDRFQPLLVHLVVAHHAHAVAAAVDAAERLVDQVQHVALRVGEAEQELLGVGVRCLVGDVLGALLVRLLAVGLVLVVRDEDLRLLDDEPLAESLQLLLVHSRHRLVLVLSPVGRAHQGIP